MVVHIQTTHVFLKNVKKLAKRYISLKDDLCRFRESIEANPLQGVDLGDNMRKVRMAISSKGKGKSAGARIITYCAEQHEQNIQITLLTIYDKSDAESITDSELIAIRKSEGI